ncbi:MULTISPECIES: ribonucleotide reductase subunit alpha [unclassified Adlercreutzia]|uniref:ribonucleotide reductase subunit alpha n=1 Tax=unclassified Adlercreutzia TaxID=2636013 RepID=UPI0013EA4424|nr:MULTISPECIES: ribonucleotide reductase subunit alpha [unclassified Adlercreutzia]
MLENFEANTSSCDDGSRGQAAEYLKRAMTAVSDGDAVLGMHLYMAAFEEAAHESDAPSEDAVFGLKKAWALACSHKERSLAEYIFERMEPYLTPDEVAVCSSELQNLALDKLEEYGLSRTELEDMAQMITEDFLGLDAHVVKIDHILSHKIPAAGLMLDVPGEQAAVEEPDASSGQAALGAPAELAASGAPAAGASASAAAVGSEPSHALAASEASASAPVPASEAPEPSEPSEPSESPAEFLAKAAEELSAKLGLEERVLTYDNLAGYDSTIQVMRDFGIGLQDDAEFQKFVGLMNARHGLDRMPALDTLLFRSPAREDANRFAEATLGELELPTLRMHMEESLQGMPVLCVTVQASKAVKISTLRDAFASGGVLLLEDLDLWSSPIAEMNEESNNFLMAQLTRGAREAVSLISWAVDNPDVYVLVTSATNSEIDSFFLDLLEPLTLVDIDFPTPEERIDIWMDIAREHPSMRGVNRADLVRLSANMPRFDMYMAAREALEDAYKTGLMMRRYQPVTRDNLFDKLAAYQPLDSTEYHELEEAVIRDFRADLSHIDDLLRGE